MSVSLARPRAYGLEKGASGSKKEVNFYGLDALTLGAHPSSLNRPRPITAPQQYH